MYENPTTPSAQAADASQDANALPKWRYELRQHLLPIVRAETPYVAALQRFCRTPFLDSYFAFTANLGTHTFFTLMLPIAMWCGQNDVGRGLYHLLAWGVIVSGILKDLLCLPRPISPPLQRITMSGSAALEYGFPSTHATNAASVAAWGLYALHHNTTMTPTTKFFLQALCYLYIFSILFGRIYCGMHGFFDVFIGSAIGLILFVFHIHFSDDYNRWVSTESPWNCILVGTFMLIVVRLHPEPADNCPCFEDSVAFAGVIIGADIAMWRYAHNPLSLSDPVPGTTPYSYAQFGLTKSTLRIVLGVFTVFGWRALMKPLLFKLLPPVFRIFERLSLDLPRRYFLKASQYSKIPRLQRDDNVIPAASDIPKLINSVRQRKGRAVSVGPQSAADAYETIAYRREQRQRSLSGSSEKLPSSAVAERSDSPEADAYASTMDSGVSPVEFGFEHSPDGRTEPFPDFYAVDKDEETEQREIFGRLEKVRVRYDVEVVTKLIVYSGIAALAVEWIPILFEYVGLGITQT